MSLTLALWRDCVDAGRSPSQRERGLGPRTEWLSVAKLHHVAIGVTDAAVIAHGIGLLTRLPDQRPGNTRPGGDGIDSRPALQGKAQVAIVGGGRRFSLST